MAFVQHVDQSGKQIPVATKSPALMERKSMERTVNAFAVADYAYGVPSNPATKRDRPNEWSVGDPSSGNQNDPPYDILPPEVPQKLEHLQTISTDNGTVAVVYRDTKTGEVILGLRGSVTGEDWKNNLAGTVMVPPQYREAEEILRQVLKKYPDSQVTIAGHSKAGGQMQYALVANRAEIERRGVAVNGIGINPDMPLAALKELQERGLVRATDPQNDPFVLKHLDLFVVKSVSGSSELLDSVNKGKRLLGASHLGRENILFVPDSSVSANTNDAACSRGAIAGAYSGGVLGAAVGCAVGERTADLIERASAKYDNHGMSVARTALHREINASDNLYARMSDSNLSNAGGVDDEWWSKNKDAVKFAAPPINLATSPFRRARAEESKVKSDSRHLPGSSV